MRKSLGATRWRKVRPAARRRSGVISNRSLRPTSLRSRNGRWEKTRWRTRCSASITCWAPISRSALGNSASNAATSITRFIGSNSGSVKRTGRPSPMHCFRPTNISAVSFAAQRRQIQRVRCHLMSPALKRHLSSRQQQASFATPASLWPGLKWRLAAQPQPATAMGRGGLDDRCAPQF